MLIEMVAVTLTVFSGFSPLSGVFVTSENSVSSQKSTIQEHINLTDVKQSQGGVIIHDGSTLQDGLTLQSEPTESEASPTPNQALQSDLPEQTIVAMLAEPTPAVMPSETPTPQPTKTVTPKMESTATPSPTVTVTPLPTDTPTPTPAPVVAAPADLDSLFTRFSDEYKVDKELLKRIAKCESGFNNEAANGDYLGMFQYATSSWSAIRSRMGADTNPDLRKNAEETIKTASYHIANGGAGAWPSCK